MTLPIGQRDGTGSAGFEPAIAILKTAALSLTMLNPHGAEAKISLDPRVWRRGPSISSTPCMWWEALEFNHCPPCGLTDQFQAFEQLLPLLISHWPNAKRSSATALNLGDAFIIDKRCA